MIVLLVMTDGRLDCIERTIPSALENLVGPITRRVICDDSDSATYRAELRRRFPTFEVISHSLGRRGFGGAIQMAWSFLRHVPERYVFHLEDDFTFNREVPLVGMIRVLDDNPYLVQLALRRQPWNAEERAAGGIVEQYPDDFTETVTNRLESVMTRRPSTVPYVPAWLEHRRFFTTNPSLYRRELCARGWPNVDHSEGIFTHQLLEDPEVRFGFWGARDSGEWVTHIGSERVGTGY